MKKLLIVDMQKGFINKNNQFLTKNIENLVKNGGFDEIYATKFVNKPDSPYVRFLQWHRFLDEKEQEFAIDLPTDVVVIEKTSYALGGLKENFNKNDEVYICGTDYEACCLAIAFQLFDSGIRPYFVIDCVGSHSSDTILIDDFEKICVKNFGRDAIKRMNNGKQGLL